jgi:hypothetical protein
MASRQIKMPRTMLPNRRQFGAIRTEPGNLRLRRTAWWGWEDSNFQPNDYLRGCIRFIMLLCAGLALAGAASGMLLPRSRQ